MTTITIQIATEPRDTVRFHRHYNPESHKWELVRITEYHVGSYDNKQTAQMLTDLWDQVYFERTHYNATRVYIQGAYVADIFLVHSKGGLRWFIDRRLQDAVDMTFDPGGFLSSHAAEHDILLYWKTKLGREGKVFPKR